MNTLATPAADLGKPHPVAVVMGVLVAVAALQPVLTQRARDLFLGEVITGAVSASLVLVAALVAGGKGGRMRIVTTILPGVAFGRLARRSGLTAYLTSEMRILARPWAAGLLLLAGGVALATKPLYAPLIAVRSVEVDNPFDPMAEGTYRTVEEALGIFQGAHKSFVVGGAVLVVVALVTLLASARR
ncbi:MAG: hypothetical protein RIF41_02870 [Polyangiaceae bacterium]